MDLFYAPQKSRESLFLKEAYSLHYGWLRIYYIDRSYPLSSIKWFCVSAVTQSRRLRKKFQALHIKVSYIA